MSHSSTYWEGISQPLHHYFVPYNGKIADITHADTLKHTLDLAAALTETRNIVAIIPLAYRMAGTGAILAYPNEGSAGVIFGASEYYVYPVVLAANMNRLQYVINVANDDYDVFCLGYVVKA